MALQVLVFPQGKRFAPLLLIKVRLNHVPPVDTVLSAQLLRVRDKHKAPRRIGRPYPDRKHHRDQQTLHGPGWDVEDDAFFFFADALRNLLSLTAVRYSQIRSRCQFHCNGATGSRVRQACSTKDLRLPSYLAPPTH